MTVVDFLVKCQHVSVFLRSLFVVRKHEKMCLLPPRTGFLVRDTAGLILQ